MTWSLAVILSSCFWCEFTVKSAYLISTLTTPAWYPCFLRRPPTLWARESKTFCASSFVDTSLDKVVEFPTPFASAFSDSTIESSIPLANSHRRLPWLFKCNSISFGSAFARSPIVWISSFLNVSTLECPAIKRAEIGSGHIFSWISFLKSVWTRSGFSKSDAIFANTFTSEIPILTVNPNRFFTSSLISNAASTGDANRPEIPVKSM